MGDRGGCKGGALVTDCNWDMRYTTCKVGIDRGGYKEGGLVTN